MPFPRHPWSRLVEALQHRFSFTSVPYDFSSSVWAFADAMREVYRKFGDDQGVVAITADALMNTNPWNLYEKKTKQPNFSIPVLEIKKILERALKYPESHHHTGILHMYSHPMEISDTPEAAIIAADCLRNLVPDSGHLCHMPSHIDVLVGDYRRAIEANKKATIVDDKFFAKH